MQQTFNAVLPILSPRVRTALVLDQAEWLVELDNACRLHEANTRSGDEPSLSTPGDFECMTEYMTMRTRVLRVMDPNQRPSGIAGEYTTWMGGGTLKMSEMAGNQAAYELSVASRSHTGDIGGIMKVSADGRSATGGAEMGAASGDSETSCRMEFTITPLIIDSVEHGCDEYRGAGVSFTQRFYRMADDPGQRD